MSQDDYQPTDRRPIKSRDTTWAAGIASWLAARGVSANMISVLGMIAAIGAGVAFAATSHTTDLAQRGLWLAGAVLCQGRLLCNLFDGMVAIARGIDSPKGELYNEVPDRISDAAIFIGLGYAAGSEPVLGYAAALLAVFVAYVRAMGKSMGAPNDFCGPMAKPQRMALATLLAAYLALAPTAWRLSGDAAGGEVKGILLVIIIGCTLTAVRRLMRAAKYLEGHAS